MSHNINENRMFCVGKAWHSIGQRVDTEVKASEAIKLARLDYEVKKAPVSVLDKIIPDTFATYREDTKHVFGIIKDRYKMASATSSARILDSFWLPLPGMAVMADGRENTFPAPSLHRGP